MENQVVVHVSGGNARVASKTTDVQVHVLDFDSYEECANMGSLKEKILCGKCKKSSTVWEWNAAAIYLQSTEVKRIQDALVDPEYSTSTYFCPQCFQGSKIFDLKVKRGMFSSIKELKLDIEAKRTHILDLWHDYTKSIWGEMEDVLPGVQVYDRHYGCFPNIYYSKGVGSPNFHLYLEFQKSDGYLCFSISEREYYNSYQRKQTVGEPYDLNKTDEEWIIIFEKSIREYLTYTASRTIKS